MNNPFSAAAASFAELRHMEMYNGLPAQLLHHLHPQFLHPGLPFGTAGAFRPLVELKSFQPPSAFAPPNKVLKIATSLSDNEIIHTTNHSISSMFSPSSDNRNYINAQVHADSLSPVSVSMSPPLGNGGRNSEMCPQNDTSMSATASDRTTATPTVADVKQEHLEQQPSDGTAPDSNDNGSTHRQRPDISDQQPMFRVESLYGNNMPDGSYNLTTNQHDYTKARFMFQQVPGNKAEQSCCPVCGVCLQSGELESHFLQELERLCKLTCSRNQYDSQRLSQNMTGSVPDHRWEIFERIKSNRQDRLKSKLRKRKADEVSCPICNRGMLRNSEELNAHIGQCLRKHRMNSPSNTNEDDELVDIEGDTKSYVESSWPEDLRSPRSGSLINFPRTITPSSSNLTGDQDADVEGDDGDEEDLIVDADDLRVSTQYSPTPYGSDSEVVQSGNADARDRDVLICSPDDAQQSQVNSTVNSSGDNEAKIEAGVGQPCDSNVSTSDSGTSSRAELLKELKAKIRELEDTGTSSEDTGTPTSDATYKCLICMDNYKNPVISTTCWHVHCEECWLHTLETRKKMCPQCNVVTSSADLRRIFM